jgi:predicted nucleotidyltransferase
VPFDQHPRKPKRVKKRHKKLKRRRELGHIDLAPRSRKPQHEPTQEESWD